MLTKWIGKLQTGFVKSIAIVVVLVFWELLPRTGLISSETLPPFSVVISKFLQMLVSGELIKHIAISLKRAFSGFALAVVIAGPLGFLLGWSEKAERIIDPPMQLARNTPSLALYPLFIVFLGLGESSKTAIILWGASWPVLINAIGGVKAVDPLLIKAARSMGASQLVLFFRVILPSAFPTLFTGIRLAASRSVIILVAAEMLGSSFGLGHLIFVSEANYLVDKMYAGIITLIILGVLINYILVAYEKRITRWKEEIIEV